METIYKDLFEYILSYLTITDVFHLKQTSKKIFEKIKETYPKESDILNGTICTLCYKKFKQPTRLNKVIMICSRKHPLSSHFSCWKKWKQQNIGVVTTDVNCFLQNCRGCLTKVGETINQKPTKNILNKQMNRARLNTLNTIIKTYRPFQPM